jgi:hypothetical protein
MSNEKDPRVIIPMPQDLVDRIDDFRFRQRVPSRTEAIRRLIAIALDGIPVLTELLAYLESVPEDPEVQDAVEKLRAMLSRG